MKKKGFTLTEILIALGIIGVIAAILLPSMTNSYKRRLLNTQRENAVTDIQNSIRDHVIKNMNMDEIPNATAEDVVKEALDIYNGNATVTVTQYNGGGSVDNEQEAMKKGTNITNAVALITIDVNGGDGPNSITPVRGLQDQFEYILNEDGMIFPANRDYYEPLGIDCTDAINYGDKQPTD